ncbi:Histidine kinase domain-containing protein [Agreia sp. COWG]|nr:Histidine kinase domain-containing protein [Agreia sp. COWG]
MVQLGVASFQLVGDAAVRPGAVAIAVGLAIAGPAALIAARRFPGPVVVVAAVVAVLDVLVDTSIVQIYLALAFSAGLAVVRGARRWALLAVAGGWLAAFVGGSILGLDWSPLRIIGGTLALLFVLGFADSVRNQRERFAQLRAMQTRRRVDAAQEERVRIARELHDVLAHSLSSINVQAGVGLHLLDSQPEKAGEALASIKATSKQALDEVRGVLGILRSDDPYGDDSDTTSAPRTPEKDLATLPGLIESTRSPELDVDFENGITSPPSAAVQLALYRIAQESLTNIVRHSGASHASIVLGQTGSHYVLTVSDNGAGLPGDVGEVAGRGLLGMRERAELLGGRLEAASGVEGGGFTVSATIPRATDASARRGSR